MMGALASLRLTLAMLAALSGWLWLGAALTNSQAHGPAFMDLNQRSLIPWLAEAVSVHPMAAAWVIVFLVLGAMLGVNLLVCAWVRLVPTSKVNPWRKRLSLVVHLLMLTVMAAHGASFVMGHKQFALRLGPGQTVGLPEGLQVRLQSVTYAADPAILKLNRKAARRAMSRQAFSRHENSAQVVVLEQGRQTAGGTLRYFEPLHVQGVGLHLTGFYIDKATSLIGITLNVADSPLWPLFSTAYAAVIGFLLLLMLLEIRAYRRSR